MKITIKDESFDVLCVIDDTTKTDIYVSESTDIEHLMGLFRGDITINVKDGNGEYDVIDKYIRCSCTETSSEKYITAHKEKKPTTNDATSLKDLSEQITNIELAICEIYESLGGIMYG